jgi:hypothetical protein
MEGAHCVAQVCLCVCVRRPPRLSNLKHVLVVSFEINPNDHKDMSSPVGLGGAHTQSERWDGRTEGDKGQGRAHHESSRSRSSPCLAQPTPLRELGGRGDAAAGGRGRRADGQGHMGAGMGGGVGCGAKRASRGTRRRPVCPAFVRATGASAARPAAPARSLETHLALVRLLAGLGQQDAARGLRERAWRRKGERGSENGARNRRRGAPARHPAPLTHLGLLLNTAHEHAVGEGHDLLDGGGLRRGSKGEDDDGQSTWSSSVSAPSRGACSARRRPLRANLSSLTALDIFERWRERGARWVGGLDRGRELEMRVREGRARFFPHPTQILLLRAPFPLSNPEFYTPVCAKRPPPPRQSPRAAAPPRRGCRARVPTPTPLDRSSERDSPALGPSARLPLSLPRRRIPDK